jgi:hypothetical protein
MRFAVRCVAIASVLLVFVSLAIVSDCQLAHLDPFGKSAPALQPLPDAANHVERRSRHSFRKEILRVGAAVPAEWSSTHNRTGTRSCTLTALEG